MKASADPSALAAFAATCADALLNERTAMMARKEVMHRYDMIRVIDQQARIAGLKFPKPRLPKGLKTPRARNELFDALAAACGYPEKPTRTACRTIGSALAEIQEADPNTTREELTRRTALIRHKYEKAGPMAVSAHWHEYGGNARTKTARRDIYTEPINWRETLRRIGTNYNTATIDECLSLPWKELSPTVRELILVAS